jgi:hypothetical protein
LALLVFFSVISLSGQRAIGTNSQGVRLKKSFVFIFRQGPTRLSDEDQKQRTEEVRDWALEQIKQGRNLEPRVLGDESYRLEEDARNQSDDGTVVALNFIEATDITEAVSIAKTHPGLRYGIRIEVRSWMDPRLAQSR